MKQIIKLLLSFLCGAVAATMAISFFLPPRLVSVQSVAGEMPPIWSLEAFEKINEEMPNLVSNPNLTMAVIPASGGNGYQIRACDDRLRARFGFASWEPALRRIKDRMEQLREHKRPADVSGDNDGQAR